MTKFKEFFIYFICYSMIGWLYEVFLEVFVYRWGFSNRGTLFGPYCIIYGFGALLIIICFDKLRHKRFEKLNFMPVVIFLGIMLLTTFIELIGSYLLEFIYGNWSWDYSNFKFNYQGRIALNTSMRFGIGGMFFLYILQPLFNKIVHKLKRKQFDFLSISLMIVVAVDFIYTFVIK